MGDRQHLEPVVFEHPAGLVEQTVQAAFDAVPRFPLRSLFSDRPWSGLPPDTPASRLTPWLATVLPIPQ